MSLDAEAKPEQLIHGRGSFGNLRLSPGGGRLAFVSSRGAHSFVGVYDFGAKTVHYLDPAVDRDGAPAFSPDGSEVAFLRTPPVLERFLFVPNREGPPWSIRVASVKDPGYQPRGVPRGARNGKRLLGHRLRRPAPLDG